jgi:DNA end-binding protein Ku
MRPVWRGAISFGLVTIPVKLYAATERKNPHFTLLHGDCRTPVRYAKWCPHCERELSMDEIVRGFEVEPGTFVLFDDEELADLPLPTARTVHILDFVDLGEVDPIYYDRTYFLEPGEGGERAYSLLRRAMAETRRAAVAKVLLRTKETLAGIRVFDDRVLAMQTMYYDEEVRPADAVLTLDPAAALDERELEMAKTLIGNLVAPFSPERYRSEYRAALHDLIRERVEGQRAVHAEKRPAAQAVDLMDALRESVRQAEAERGRRGGGRDGQARAPA